MVTRRSRVKEEMRAKEKKGPGEMKTENPDGRVIQIFVKMADSKTIAVHVFAEESVNRTSGHIFTKETATNWLVTCT